MALQLRRGSNTARASTVFAAGEPVWTTDTNQLYIGNGIDPGGVLVAGGGGGSTNTFVNATIDTELSIGTGTYRMLLGQSPVPYDNQFYITGNNEVNDKLFIDNFNFVQFNSELEVASTASFAGSVYIGTGTSRIYENTDLSNRFSIYSNNNMEINGEGITMYPHSGGVTIDGNLTVNQTASVAAASVNTELSIGTGTYRMLLGQSPTPFDNQFYITGNSSVNDKLFFDNFNLVQINTGNQLQVESTATFNGNVNVNTNNTVTIAGMSIGLNNGAVVMPAATVASSATTVLFQTIPGAGGNIIFNMNRFGVQWPLAITRTGGIAFSHGQQIFPGQTTNVGALSVQAGSTATGTANQLLLSSGGSGTGPLARGVFNDGTGFTVGTRTSGGATAFNSSVFDLNGGLTLPKSLAVGTTATVNSLSVTTTATMAGLVLGSDPVITSRSELIGPTGPQGPAGQSASIYDYRANTGATSGNPGSGFVLWNNATQQSATELIFSHINDNGDDIEYLLGFLAVGDSIRLQDQTNSENNQVWTINSPVVVTTGSYVTVPVSLSTSTHSFGNNNVLGVIIRTAGVVGPTGAAGPTGPQGPGADQSLNTTSNVTFANAVVTTRIDTSQIYANATTQDLTLTAAFNGAGSGAGGSVNIFSSGGSASSAKVEILGDAINFKSADSTVNYGGFGFDTGLSVSTTATVGALRFGTETAITSRSELIGPTGPAGDPGAAGPTGPAGATGGYSGTESVYALGNTSGTLSVDATSATIFTMTLTGNLTMNAITNVVTGTNATFVITQDGTGGRTLTSSWKFAGGARTLTTSATATDMISVFYDGSTYYASLSRGFV